MSLSIYIEALYEVSVSRMSLLCRSKIYQMKHKIKNAVGGFLISGKYFYDYANTKLNYSYKKRK